MGEQSGDCGTRHTLVNKDAETCSGLVRLSAHISGNWRPGQRVYGGRAGRQRECKPLTPPPALTSHLKPQERENQWAP